MHVLDVRDDNRQAATIIAVRCTLVLAAQHVRAGSTTTLVVARLMVRAAHNVFLAVLQLDVPRCGSQNRIPSLRELTWRGRVS